MKSIFYGVGVGPGDPDMITAGALRVLRESDVIAVPAEKAEKSTAWQILRQAEPEMAGKPVLPLAFPMTHTQGKPEKSHREAAGKIVEQLAQGRQTAFICIGDPGIYSTFSYTADRIRKAGYPVRVICGIPSFCAAAASAGIDLVQGKEPLHIFGDTDDVRQALKLPGTKVFMKSGREAGRLLQIVQDSPAAGGIWLVENAGKENERIYTRDTGFPAAPGYFSLLIVKEKQS